MAYTYHKHNFFKHTYCVFREVALADFPFDTKQPHYKSKSGSLYFYTEEGVYRLANHWGRAANCRWRLSPLPEGIGNRTKIGYARWKDFYKDSDTEKLYFISMENGEVVFHHKEELPHTGKIVRTAAETASTIRKIKKLLEGNHYFTEEEIQDKIHQLIYSEI